MSRAVALAVLAVTLLAGCTASSPESGNAPADHAEAKAQLVTLLEIAQDAVGGEWERSDTGARDCDLGFSTGASYALNRYGPGVAEADQQLILDSIAAAWAKKGVDVVVTTLPEVNEVVVTELRYPGTGRASGGFYVQLWMSDRASAVGGQTRCASGDAAEINAG